MQGMAAAAAAAAAISGSLQLRPALSTKTLTDLLRSNSIWKLKLYKAPSDHYDDFDQFCDALELNESITATEVTWRFLRQLPDPQRIRLMQTIGGLPALQKIAMEVVGPTSVLSAALSNATTALKSLKIGKLRFSNQNDVTELAQAIRNCRSLVQISLSTFQVMVVGNHVLDNEGMVWFMENQNANQRILLDPLLNAIASLPQLQHLRFQHYLNGSRIQPPTEESLRSLCQSPRQSLIFNSCGLLDEQCIALADELKDNNLPLSILVVTRNPSITPLGWDAFINMLKVNYNIVDFHHGEDDQPNAPLPEQQAKIEYYLRLNFAGRKNLLTGSARREAWFDFLVHGRNDLDMVFFALQVDPSLYIMRESMS